MKKLHEMTNRELIDVENELDFRDPDIYTEIFKRAEQLESGITERYINSFDNSDDTDGIFDHACDLLLKEG